MDSNQSSNFQKESQFQVTDTSLEKEIDLILVFKDVWRIIKSKFWILLTVLIISTFGFGFGKFYLQKPLYRSEAIIFLTPKVTSTGDLDQASLNANKSLLNNAIELITQQNIMKEVANQLGNLSANQVKESLKVGSVNQTELISIASTTSNPVLSQTIANLTTESFIKNMKDNLNLENISVVTTPEVPQIPVSDSLFKTCTIGFLIGLALDALYLIVYMLFNQRLIEKEDAEEFLQIPVLVVIPDFGEIE